MSSLIAIITSKAIKKGKTLFKVKVTTSFKRNYINLV
jgi:hypothetical protein